jgi:RNA polymerase sigma-70 factor, ECF subfamily
MRDAHDAVDSRTDAQLLASGGGDEFMLVCDRHGAALRAWLRLRTRNGDVAAELLAETLAAAWAGRKRFRDPGDGSAAPWLFGIAAKQAALYWRKRRVASAARERIGMTVRSYDADPFDEADERLLLASLAPDAWAAIAGLPPDQRDALTLRVADELGYADVARRLHISEGAARTRVSRALSTLRSRLQGADR